MAKSRYELTSAESDLLGGVYDPETGNIFVVNDGDRKVYEIPEAHYEYNTLVNTFGVTDLTLDLEGISSLDRYYFAITDENPAKIIKVKLNADGTITDSSTLSSGITPAAGSNSGFEGVMIGTDYYAVQEQTPAKLWKLPASAIAHSETWKETTRSTDLSVGGLTRGGDATDEVFMVVKNWLKVRAGTRRRRRTAGWNFQVQALHQHRARALRRRGLQHGPTRGPDLLEGRHESEDADRRGNHAGSHVRGGHVVHRRDR